MHPLQLSRLSRFYPVTVTIQQYTATQNAVGEEVKTWANVAGHVDLPCVIATPGMGSSGNESKRPDGTVSIWPRRIAIAAIYANITTKMRAVLGGVNYDILAVHHDSHSNMTSLDVEVVR